MNTNTFSDEQIDDNIRSLLDNRTELARTAARSYRDLEIARESFEQAQRDYNEAFNAAVKGGWKTTELTAQLGLAKPESKPRRRRASKKDTKSQQQPES